MVSRVERAVEDARRWVGESSRVVVLTGAGSGVGKAAARAQADDWLERIVDRTAERRSPGARGA